MTSNPIHIIDFYSLAPYVRFVREDHGIGFKVPPRIIYDYEIIYIAKGILNMTIEDQEHTLHPGDILFIKPYVQHSIASIEGSETHTYSVHYDPIYFGEGLNFSADDIYLKFDYPRLNYIPIEEDLANRPVVEIRELSIPLIVKTHDPLKYFPLLTELLKAYEQKAYGYQLKMRANMLQILCLIIEDISTQDAIDKTHPHRNMVTEVVSFIKSNYQEPIDFKELADTFNFSHKYFRVLFKQATGKNLLEYQTAIRLEKSKEYLIEGTYTISEISVLVGYDDIHYFSKIFKKVEGLSPKKYAESIRNSYIN